MRTITVFYDGSYYTFKWIKALLWAKKEIKELGYKIRFQNIFEYLPVHMDDKVLLPDEWKTLPKDELDMLNLESAPEDCLPEEGDGAQKEVTGNAGMDT